MAKADSEALGAASPRGGHALRESTAKALLDAEVRPSRPGQRMRDVVVAKLDALEREGHAEAQAYQKLLPHTVLDDAVLRTVVASLLAGSHLLVLGPPGSGKTSLAKDLWALYPKEVHAVVGCPVQDDPFSLVDTDFADQVPPCPWCVKTYGGVSMRELGEFDAGRVDPAAVPIHKIRLREGHGLARIQGSPEVFPDNLTGSLNLAKLEQVGDPMSPLVLEPGKVMQANRGFLLIDEIGKLPRGTQNVLLEALQENIVTPAKSRESFPADFVAVTTSNLDDVDNITEPLIGRLTNLYVPFNHSHGKNRTIVDMGVEGANLLVPAIVREAAVHLIEAWRRTSEAVPEFYEVGSNRTMIDLVKRAEAYALLASRAAVAGPDFLDAARDVMRGRIRARGGEAFLQNVQVVDAFLHKHGPSALKVAAEQSWCRFFVEELNRDKGEAFRVVQDVRASLAKGVEGLASSFATNGKADKFADHVARHEITLDRAADAKDKALGSQAVFRLFEDAGLFDERGPRDEAWAAAEKYLQAKKT